MQGKSFALYGEMLYVGERKSQTLCKWRIAADSGAAHWFYFEAAVVESIEPAAAVVDIQTKVQIAIFAKLEDIICRRVV